LLVTDAVLLEVGNALAQHFRREAVEIIEQFLHAPEVEVIYLTPSQFTAAFALYKNTQTRNGDWWTVFPLL
jgi:hypothetical protein